MLLKRRPKVFLSYSHEDIELMRKLKTWLVKQGLEVVIDERGIHPSDTLDLVLRDQIDKSDCLLAIGTSNFMMSDWCRKEVEYALHKGKIYYPILFLLDDEKSVPGWFKGGSLPGQPTIVFTTCDPRYGFEPLRKVVSHAKIQPPISLRWLVAIAFILLFFVPPTICWTIKEIFDNSAGKIREIQDWVETQNKEVEKLRRGHDSRLISEGSEYIGYILYRDKSTGAIVVRDTFLDGKIKSRQFFSKGQLVAADDFDVFVAPNGELSAIKAREISLENGDDIIIEDRFDSVGNLILKRVRRKGAERWRRYADVMYSAYPRLPPLLLPYR